jgi:V-type H+-transporting ATPase subunit C
MSIVGQEFWLVAAGCPKGRESHQSEKEQYFSNLKHEKSLSTKSREDPVVWKFSVPEGDRALMFGSFDNLIRLTDDLAKYDTQVDGIIHRLERQYLELDPKGDFKVKSQRTNKTFNEYIQNWTWDDAKYPRSRSIVDLVVTLMSNVNKLDEECRNKSAQFNELKTQKGNISKKDAANLAGRDLVDVLTPSAVSQFGEGSFVYTEYITTVVVILSRGTDQDFLKCYERLAENVVPMSAMKFTGMDDKDGNSLWRVVMFKTALESFKKGCREKRFVVRDFEYSKEAYDKLKVTRDKVEEDLDKQHKLITGLYQAAWSDVLIAWMHVKAMRVFVESVLRFGMPPSFACFMLKPKSSNQVAARKALADILGKTGSGISGPYAGASKDKSVEQEEGEEYFPYVSFSFTPFTTARG